jgi:hypothetical protein
MKKKINVKIHKNGDTSRVLLDSIGTMNEGKVIFSARDVEGYINIQKAFTPTMGKGYCIIPDKDEPNTYHISEDGGKTFTLSLEWVEVMELQNDADDITESLNGMPDIDREIEKELLT